MKPQKPILEIVDHPKVDDYNTFYACPSGKEFFIVATKKSDEWTCSCPRYLINNIECEHIRKVRLFLLFAEERQEEITQVLLESLPKKARSAISRFSLVEV